MASAQCMPRHLADAVRSNQADFGVALDGDADRVVVADADGRLYNGDELLYIIVRDRMRHAARQGRGRHADDQLLARAPAARARHVPFARARVGDRYVLEMLEEKEWLYGGEGSGHLLCLDCHTTGDGIVSALQVLSAVQTPE